MYITDSDKFKMAQIAKMYYEESLTQEEIARRVHISRPMVSKLLSQAREIGIVRIIVSDVAGDDDDELLRVLRSRYKLDGCLIIPDSEHENSALKDAAAYIRLEMQDSTVLGLGWGDPMGKITGELAAVWSTMMGPRVVCPLIGRPSLSYEGYRVNEMALKLAAAQRCQNVSLDAPAFATSRDEEEAVEASSNYRDVSDKWDALDMALITVQNYPASPDEATETRFGRVLQRQSAIGSFLSYFYNAKGDILSGENDFTCHVPLACLRRCKKVVALCLNAGSESIRGALNTGIITHAVVRGQQARDLI